MRNLASVNHSAKSDKYSLEQHEYSQLKTHHDKKNKIGWLYMIGMPRPYFTPQLLNDISYYHQQVQHEMEISEQSQYDYVVFASDESSIFSLGKDLELIYQLIKQQNKELLSRYAKNCISLIHQHLTHLNSDLTTVSLVQGDALS